MLEMLLLGPLIEKLERDQVQILLLLAGATLIALALYLPHHHRLSVLKALA